MTVTVHEVVVLSAPSLTIKLMIAEPLCPLTGVTTTVRFASAPPNTIFAFGTSEAFELLPVRVRAFKFESTSATVIANEVVEAS